MFQVLLQTFHRQKNSIKPGTFSPDITGANGRAKRQTGCAFVQLRLCLIRGKLCSKRLIGLFFCQFTKGGLEKIMHRMDTRRVFWDIRLSNCCKLPFLIGTEKKYKILPRRMGPGIACLGFAFS